MASSCHTNVEGAAPGEAGHSDLPLGEELPQTHSPSQSLLERGAWERSPLLPPCWLLEVKEANCWVVSCSSGILTGTSTKPQELIATEADLSLH